MNTLDIIILIPLAYFAFKGFTKGFIITLAMLAGILIGLYAAIHFSEYSTKLLQDNLNFHSSNIRMISYLITFIVVLVLVYLLGKFLTGVVKTTGLGFVNRLAGLLLGIAKGLLIISAFVVLFGKIDPKSYLIPLKSKQESILYKPVSAIAPKIFPVMEQYTDKAKDLILGEEKEKD
jgi:membrane protein required for colicin V production